MKNIIQKVLLFMLAIILNGEVGLAQKFECGSNLSNEMANTLLNNRIKNSTKINKSANSQLTVAVLAHIIDESISIHELDGQIRNLNADFQEANIRFDICEVNSIDDSSLANVHIGTSAFSRLVNTDAAENLVNIYFVDNITATVDEGTIGTIGGASDPFDNYVVMSSVVIGSNSLEHIITHEFGHYFGLLHTFDQSGDAVEHPERSGPCANCDTHGDGFCQTEADFIEIQNDDCIYVIESFNCSGDPTTYSPPCENFMSYYGNTMREFTSDQIDVMRSHRLNQRDKIKSNCNGPTIDGSNPPVFECSDFCYINTTEDYLSIECSDVSITSANNILHYDNIRVTNFSENTIRNLVVEFWFVGHPHRIGTRNISIIEPYNFRDLQVMPLGSNVSTGDYQVEIRLVHNSSTFHSCTTIDPLHVTKPPGSSCDEEIIRSNDLGSNRNVTYEAGRLVEFQPGFIADSERNVKMLAYIDPCNNLQEETETNETAALSILDIETKIEIGETKFPVHQSLGSDIEPSESETQLLGSELFNSFEISNYPNPFSLETTIELVLNKSDQVRITMSDLNGKLLKDIKEAGTLSEGNYQFTVDASQYQPGIYYYTVIVGAEQKTGKMILIK